MVGLDKWIGVSWVRWWRGFGSIVANGFGSWKLVGFLVEIGGFLGLVRCSVYGLVMWVWIGVVVAGARG